MNNADKPMRKSSVEKYFKALQELYYRINTLGETNLSLNEFCKEKVISGLTKTTLKKLGIITNSGHHNHFPVLKWNVDKPTKIMAETIIKENRDKLRPYENSEIENTLIDQQRLQLSGLALQGLLASNNGQSPEYLAQRAVKCADELLKQLETK